MDLNADVGEGFPHDDELLSLVTSANVACGFHAGDPAIMERICEISRERGISVGAQVSYRDRGGFGRRDMDVPPAELAQDVAEQVAALQAAATCAGVTVCYLKPHGALYNRVVWDGDQAAAVLAGSARLPVLGLPGSVILDQARAAGRTTAGEFFADRAYTSEGRLVPRGEPGALVDGVDEIETRVRRLVTDGVVVSIDHEAVSVDAESICVHGDSPSCVEAARAVRRALEIVRIPVRPWR